MNIKEKFLELTQYTEVLGQEDLIRKYLPKELTRDHVGNYWMKIGKSDTMFTSHLDTAAFKREKVNHVFDDIETKSGNKEYFIETDGSTLLGADDRAGVVIMMYMIEHNIPGLYYFFMGEESGTIGSSNILKDKPEIFEEYKKCISFDRKGYGSIITVQMGGRCCSPAFATALAKQLSPATGHDFKADPTGIYTDSAVFMDDIEECTNLSVGYFNEHSVGEFQNLTYLEDFCEGVIKVDWENLPIERECGPIDTPNPKRKPKKDDDLTDIELSYIFMDIEDIFDETQMKDCANSNNFIPEKEMLFVSYYDDDNIISVWVHEDGSITIGNDEFKDLAELEDKIEAIYGYRLDDNDSDNDLPFDPDDPKESNNDNDDSFDSDDIDLSKNTFTDGMKIENFISDVAKLNQKEISAHKINGILNKYNKTIESLIIWIFNYYNDPSKTMGLTWDDVDDQFEYDPDYNKVKSTGVDVDGARDFN